MYCSQSNRTEIRLTLHNSYKKCRTCNCSCLKGPLQCLRTVFSRESEKSRDSQFLDPCQKLKKRGLAICPTFKHRVCLNPTRHQEKTFSNYPTSAVHLCSLPKAEEHKLHRRSSQPDSHVRDIPATPVHYSIWNERMRICHQGNILGGM